MAPELLKAIQRAILDAFPAEDSLAELLLYRMNITLDRIVAPGPLEVRVTHLIQWAQANARLNELIQTAARERPGNGALQRIRQAVGAHYPRKGAGALPRTSTGRLPATATELFGRDDDLALLDAAWADDTNVVVIVAFGGAGKSSLVNHWLRKLGAGGYEGASRVYGWSFLNQGRFDDAASADLFIDTTLRWFGDLDPGEGTPWEKGERLADRIRDERTLIVLDGLEALQHGPGPRHGQLRDQAMQALLRALAELNPGLCVISTRTWTADLADFESTTVKRKELSRLSTRAGVEMLRSQGVKGEGFELETVVEHFHGHAFTLKLLGNYLSGAHEGDIRAWKQIGSSIAAAGDVMLGYERWFGEGPELAILCLLSLFDGPCDIESIDCLRAAPVITGLTEPLQDLNDVRWRQALQTLRGPGLIMDTRRNNELESHPLAREHFAQRLQATQPEAWRQANARLFDLETRRSADLPETLEGIWPLFSAIRYGCRAGRHQEALDDVYWRRISRGEEHFHVRSVAAFDAALACMSHFFTSQWNVPLPSFSDSDRRFLLVEAAFLLEGTGRPADALQPAHAGLTLALDQKDTANAAVSYYNLCGLYRSLGNLQKALEHSKRGLELARKSDMLGHRAIAMAGVAVTLHQLGRLEESEKIFTKIEKWRALRDQSRAGQVAWRYWLLDLMLDQGRYVEVIDRARYPLPASTSPLGEALHHLPLGRACLMRAAAGGGDFREAAAHVDQSVDGLRRSGRQAYLPAALLARAEIATSEGRLDDAHSDAVRALTIAERGHLRLAEADCYLALAGLHIALEDPPKAVAALDRAASIIKESTYHRRDGSLQELRQRLRAAATSPRSG